MHTASFYTHRGFYTEKPLHTGAVYTQKVLHREVFTLRSFCTQTPRSLYTQKLLHKEVFTQRAFYTQTRLHTEAFTQRSLHTEELLHTKAFTHRKLLHSHRGFYTEKSLHKGAFYTQKVLHRAVFTPRSFCTQTSGSFFTQNFLHEEGLTERVFTHRRVCTQKLLHRKAFTQRSFYTRKLLHTVKSLHRRFTQRSFHTQKLLHKEVFTQSCFYIQKLLHTKAFTQRSLCTEAPVHEVTSWNWQQFFGKNPCHDLPWTFFKKHKEYISEAGPHPKLSSPHCDEMEGREIRRSRRGASALKSGQGPPGRGIAVRQFSPLRRREGPPPLPPTTR